MGKCRPRRKMANQKLNSGSLKRSHSETGLDTDEEEVKPKYRKGTVDVDPGGTEHGSPLKRIASNSTIPTSPLADSGYDISVADTPGSTRHLNSIQPSSSGYISGSECGTPAFGQANPGSFFPPFIPRETKTIAPYSPDHLKNFIQRRYTRFKDEVIPTGIANMLFTSDTISGKDIESISEAKLRREKCDLLLKAIVRSPSRQDIHTSTKVIFAFEKEGYSYLFDDFDKEIEPLITPKEASELTKEEIKGRLYINSKVLEDEIDPLLIIDDLVENEVLSLDEHEDIKQTNFKPQKVTNLIEYLLRKTGKEFWAFCNVLEDQYPNLARVLKQRISNAIDIGQCKANVLTITVAKGIKATFKHRRANGCDKKEKTEIRFYLPSGCKDEEQMIVDDNTPDIDLNLQKEAMDIGFEIGNIHISCICINLSSMSRMAQMDLLKKCRESPRFLEKWIRQLITEKHIQGLKSKNVDKMTFKVNLKLPELEQRSCSCKLTKEIIVQYYSLLEKELGSDESIIKTFGDFEGFDEKTKLVFAKLLSTQASVNKMEDFLRKLLEIPGTRLHLCLLEREMRRLHPELLQKITQAASTENVTKLSVSDIRRNMRFLVDELEPRHFRAMLTGLDGSESIMGKVMSTDPRKDRCKEFLNFVCKMSAIDMFVQQLQTNKIDHVLEFLISASKTDEDLTDLKEAFVNNHALIVDEIEPRVFRQMFVERRVIKAKEFDAICKLSTRRERAVMFLQHVIGGEASLWKCFKDALEVAGYNHLVKLINTDKDCYKECPRLHQSLLGGQNEVCFEGEIQLRIEQKDTKESDLQILLHKMIYVSEKKKVMVEPASQEIEHLDDEDEVSKKINDKRKRTSEWIATQQNCRKRETVNIDVADYVSATPAKRFCPEVALAVRGLSPSSSPTFGITRPDDMADNCSSSQFTRSTSRESVQEKPSYEDISPPPSPSYDFPDIPHVIIEAPWSPIPAFQAPKRRNSSSDSSPRTSSSLSSPSSSFEEPVAEICTPPITISRARSLPHTSMSYMISECMGHFFHALLKK